MRIGCDGEGSFNNQHNISVFFAGIGKTGASGKMVSGAMVQKTGRAARADRGGILRRHPLRLRDGYSRD